MRSRLVFIAVSLLLVLPIVTGTLSAREQTGDEDSLFKHLAVFTEVLGLVKDAYVEPTDESVLMASAVDGATDALDPFSIYVPAEGVKSYSAARAIGESHSGLMLLRERGVVFVVGVVPGSPGDKAGLRLGDIVTEIGGEQTHKTPMWEIQSQLAQPVGTKVQLDVLHNQEHETKSLELADFDVPPAELRLVDGAGVLRIYRFSSETPDQVAEALKSADTKAVDHLLIDLRGVAGGNAEAAYRVAGLFADGDLGSLKAREDQLVAFRGAPPRWHGKVVVLVDRGTLGAGEVLATVLRQKLDASLVGERTFGYAGRLKRVDLSTGGHLWITDAFYTGPDAEPVRGSLVPDLAVRDTLRGGQATDEEQLEDAIFDEGLSLLLAEDDADTAGDQKAA
ncbi:MAG: PDZ domain-containing protein [Acidobacteria bacterium]|nr:PDZ domain-containing protein [Acidobacteriota bacterium]